MHDLNHIIGVSLVGAGGISAALSEQLEALLVRAREMHYWPHETVAEARKLIEQFEPLLAGHIADATLSAWVYGFDDVAKQFPPWLQREFATAARRSPPAEPPTVSVFSDFDAEPELKLPIIDNAVLRLLERHIMTREQFDEASSVAKEDAFTIAGGLTEDTIDRMRSFLVEDLQQGTSLKGFKAKVEHHLGTSPLAPGHLENVYRTNIQAAIRDGRESLKSNPIVSATFPYQAYYATHDKRTRENHRALEKLGLDGTNVYRTDDPFWDHFTPPWDFQCRCFPRLLTIDQAAKMGVKEAQEWLKTGRPPLHPEYRLAHIPFEPREGWGTRGRTGIIAMGILRMATYRAPEGYTEDRPLMIAGKAYHGGQFIPGDAYKAANSKQKEEIRKGKKSDQLDLFDFGADEEQLEKIEAEKKDTPQLELFADAPAETAHASAPRAPKPKAKTNEGNWHYESRDFFKTGAKAKFRDNINAIKTLQLLELEDRQATPEEQETLSKYVGWGQFPQVFTYSHHRADEYYQWNKERQELQTLVGADEYEAARASTINAHYTHPDVIAAHWNMAERMGFRGGKMLEPAVGAGYYIGLMPEHLAEKTTVTAVEMDKLSGNLTKQLYPSANVQVKPFQDYKTPDDFYDLVATNVPFSGDIRILDSKYKSMRPTLHDYYFLRSIDTAKPGGLIMHLTSAGTMDKLDDRVRRHINENAEFVAAIRFPGDAHKENAGTEVVTDMIILRKKNPAIPPVTDETPSEAVPAHLGFTGVTTDSLGRIYHWQDGVRVPGPRWDDTVEVPDPDGGKPIVVNRYFAEHPEQILGKLDRSGSMYAGNMKNVTRTENYEEQLQAAIDRLPQDILRTEQAGTPKPERERLETDGQYSEGQIVHHEGSFYQHFGGALEPIKFNSKQRPLVLGQMEIRDAARALIAAQHRGEDTEAARAALNDAYDRFTAEHGPLHSKSNRDVMKLDPDGPFLLSLEKWNATSKEAIKADLFSKDTIRTLDRASKADNAADATGIVMNESGSVDVARIAELTGKSSEEIESELVEHGLAFRDPNGGKWTHAAEYLSGNTRRKLQEAKAAAESDPSYAANVAALEGAQPEDIDPEDIGLKLGAPWVPPAVIAEFSAETLGARPDDFTIRYAHEWSASYENRYIEHRRSNLEVWGVKNADGEIKASYMDVLNSALTGKPLLIRRSMKNAEGVYPVDPDATDAAREKVEDLKARFKEWVWEDAERKEQLHRHYNDNYNNIVPTHYDGSHLTLPGMVREKKGKPYELRQMQKDAIWRIVTTGKGLLAHEVGTGKTATMIASAMELRRLGLAKKPAIACLKSNIEQITASAQELYPGAKILSTADMFSADRRQKALNQIATGDYDLVIMTHDHLEAMKVKGETQAAFIREEIEELEDAILTSNQEDIAAGRKKSSNRIVKRLEGQKQKLEAKLKAALAEEHKDDIFFEDSGIDMLFVDEAHKFKTLPCHTGKGDIKGIPGGDSAQRAADMLAKTRWLLDKNDGRGVVFATGTPIANTMVELYNMQRYLQWDSLKERGLHRFDAWADTYGDITNNVEFKLNGDVKPTLRFNEFVNLPELRHLASEFMDVQLADNQKNADGSLTIKRPSRHDHVVISDETPEITSMMADIQARAKALAGRGRAEKGADNMLTVCKDAKAGSIDMRLVNPDAEDHPESKANKCVRQVLELYHKNPGKTQCIFSDMGVHADDFGFSVFEDIKRKLVAGGIPEKEIANFSHQKMKDTKREEAQAAARRGDVRIMLGSTERLGTGTNVQANLLAIHHLDIPYVPAYIEQRDGRGWRSGNTNPDVHIYRYVQQGSADHLFWQIVANKSNFIQQYMRGKGARTMKDLQTDTLTPQEMVAISTGDEAMLERVGLEDEVRKLRRAASRHESERIRIQQTLSESDKNLEMLHTKLRDHEKDMRSLEEREFRLHLNDAGGFSDRKPAGEMLEKAITKAKKEFDELPPYKRPESIGIGAYNGILGIHVTPDGMLQLRGPSGQTYRSGPSLQSIEYAARNIAKRHAETQKQIRDFHSDLEKMRGQLSQPFRHRETLAEKEARLTELRNQRTAQKNEPSR